MNPDGSKPQTQLAYDARANELFFVGDLAAYNKQFDYYPAGAVVSNADPCVDQSIPVPARSSSFAAKPIHPQSTFCANPPILAQIGPSPAQPCAQINPLLMKPSLQNLYLVD